MVFCNHDDDYFYQQQEIERLKRDVSTYSDFINEIREYLKTDPSATAFYFWMKTKVGLDTDTGVVDEN